MKRRSDEAAKPLFGAVLLLLCTASAWAAPVPRRPNVVLFLVDDLGYADIGAFGVKDAKTPHLDRLARQSTRIEPSYSAAPVCTPTRLALITGQYPQRHGIEWAFLRDDSTAGLAPSPNSLPRLLADAGYATGAFGKWHLGFRPEFGPNAHGFQQSFGPLGGSVDMFTHKGVDGVPDLFENGKPIEVVGYLTDLIAERAASFVDESADKPFFLYVPFNAVHFPFQRPDRPDDIRDAKTWPNGERRDYAAMVESVDRAVGLVLRALDRHRLSDRTLVIFTNDNGGARLSDNRPFFHHKGTLWEGGIRVPSLVRFPGVVPAGRRLAQASITMDFTATILAAAGVTRTDGADGIDLLPVLRGIAKPVPRSFFWRIPVAERKQGAVRDGRWKYVRDGVVSYIRQELLFDLDRDPSERTDIARHHPDVVARLGRLFDEWEEGIASTAKPAVQLKLTK